MELIRSLLTVVLVTFFVVNVRAKLKDDDCEGMVALYVNSECVRDVVWGCSFVSSLQCVLGF